jgi:hypothetical protein
MGEATTPTGLIHGQGMSGTKDRQRDCDVVQPKVVMAYWDAQRHPRQYMDVPGDATVEDFAGVTGRFPVFRVNANE